MSNTTLPQKDKTSNRILKKIKRILFIFLSVCVLILAVFVYWKFFFTYSEGYRSGLLQKFSHKGTIFKTYEGEMIMSSVRGSNNIAIASEKFLFSVTSLNVVKQLDSLQGKDVIVHYKEKKGTLPWRGESTHIVDEVRLEK